MDFSSVTTPDSLDSDGDLNSLIGPDRTQKKPMPPIWSEVRHSSLLHCKHVGKDSLLYDRFPFIYMLLDRVQITPIVKLKILNISKFFI